MLRSPLTEGTLPHAGRRQGRQQAMNTEVSCCLASARCLKLSDAISNGRGRLTVRHAAGSVSTIVRLPVSHPIALPARSRENGLMSSSGP